MPSNTVQDRSLVAGLNRAKASFQKLIQWFSGGVSTGPAGSVTKVQLGTNLTGTQVGDTLTIDASGGGGGGGIQTVNGISPDGLGEFGIASADGSVTITGGVNGVDLAVGITYTDTGIAVTGGAKAGGTINPALATNAVSGICTSDYAYPTGGTDWQLWVYPTPASGDFTLDVRKRVFGNAEPSALDTICAAAYPTITGNGSDITSTGSISTWTASPLLKGEMFTVAPTVNTALVTWWCLFIPARRAF